MTLLLPEGTGQSMGRFDPIEFIQVRPKPVNQKIRGINPNPTQVELIETNAHNRDESEQQKSSTGLKLKRLPDKTNLTNQAK